MPPYRIRIHFTGSPPTYVDATLNAKMTVRKRRDVTSIDVPETTAQNIELLAISPALEEITVEWDIIADTLAGSLNGMDNVLNNIFRGEVLGAPNRIEIIDEVTNVTVWSRNGTIVEVTGNVESPPGTPPTRVHMMVRFMVGSVVTF